MKRWWPAVFMIVLLCAVGVAYAYVTRGEHRFLAELWAPGIATSLITTALAILLVNILLELSERRLDEAARAAEKKQVDAKERLHRARRALRRAQRKKAIQQFVQGNTYWPIVMCLHFGHEVMMVARRGTLANVLAHLRKEADTYARYAAWLRNLTLLYSRVLRLDELSLLEGVQRDLDSLGLHPSVNVSEDNLKIGITSCLEGFQASSRALFQSFGSDPTLLDEVDRYGAELSLHRRHWDVPGIRKRLGTALAPLFDAEHPEIAAKLREDPEDEKPSD